MFVSGSAGLTAALHVKGLRMTPKEGGVHFTWFAAINCMYKSHEFSDSCSSYCQKSDGDADFSSRIEWTTFGFLSLLLNSFSTVLLLARISP